MSTDQFSRVRSICLKLEGASERLSHGESVYFVDKRAFVMCADNHHRDGHIGIWVPVPSGLQASLIESDAAIYYRPPYVGVRGWVGIELPLIGEEALVYHIETAWELCRRKRAKGRR